MNARLLIDSKTHIPLFAVVASLPFIIGFVMWLSSVDTKATEAYEAQQDIKKMIWQLQKSVDRLEIKEGTKPVDE